MIKKLLQSNTDRTLFTTSQVVAAVNLRFGICMATIINNTVTELFQNSICSLKQQFFALLPSIFSTISSDMLSKFDSKFVESLSIYWSKENFEKGLIKQSLVEI